VALSISRLNKFAACPLSYAMQYRGNVGPEAARAEAEWKSLSGESDAPALGSDARWQALVHGRAMHSAMEAMALVWLGKAIQAAKHAVAGLDESVDQEQLEAIVARAVLQSSAAATTGAVEAAVSAAQAVAVAASSSPALASNISDTGGTTGSALRGKGSPVATVAAAKEAAMRETTAFNTAIQQLVQRDPDNDSAPGTATQPEEQGRDQTGSALSRLPVLVELPFALPLDAAGAIMTAPHGPAAPAVLRGIVDRVDAEPGAWLTGLARAVTTASEGAVAVVGASHSNGPRLLSGGWLVPGHMAHCLGADSSTPVALAEALGRAPAPPAAASVNRQGQSALSVLEQLHFATSVFSHQEQAHLPTGDVESGGPIIVEFKTGRAGGGQSSSHSSEPITAPQSPPPPASTRTPQTQTYAAAVAALFGRSPSKLVVVSVDGGAMRQAAQQDLAAPVAAALATRDPASTDAWTVPHAAEAVAAEFAAATDTASPVDSAPPAMVSLRGDAASWAFPPKPNAHNCSMCMVASVCPYQASRAQPVGSLATVGSAPSSPLSVPDARFPAVDRA
jgi:hypothetical protein